MSIGLGSTIEELVKAVNSSGSSITILSASVTYQASSNGTTVPSGTWSTSIPSVTNGQYLWTKTYVKYSDNTETTSYSVGYKGTNGSTPDISGKANLSGGNTFTGNQVFTGYLDIRGTAAEKHLKTRGIAGSDGNGTLGDLYLQYASDNKTLFGKNGTSSLNADGSISINGKKAATVDQIPTVPTKVSQLTNDSGYTANKGTVTKARINGEEIIPDAEGIIDLGSTYAKENDDVEFNGVGIRSNGLDFLGDSADGLISSIVPRGIGVTDGEELEYLQAPKIKKNCTIPVAVKLNGTAHEATDDGIIDLGTVNGGSSSNAQIVLKGQGATQESFSNIVGQAIWYLNVRPISGTLQVGDELVLCHNCLKFKGSDTSPNNTRKYKLRTATNQKTVITQGMIDDLKNNSFHNLTFTLNLNNLTNQTEVRALSGAQGNSRYYKTFYLRIRRKRLNRQGNTIVNGDGVYQYEYVSNSVRLTLMGGLDIKTYNKGVLTDSDGNTIAPRISIYME